MNLVELSRTAHAALKVDPGLTEAAAATQHLIPIVVNEFRKAAIQYPIVFAKSPDTGQFSAYVLTGLGLEENLFWSGTELDVAYVPLSIRRQPFYVRDKVLCIDLDHPCVASSQGKAIVNPDGGDSAYLKEVLAILGELVSGKRATDEFVAALLAADLLSPWFLDIALQNGSPLRLEGLYGLDEDRLRQLDEGALAMLWKSGYLDLIYCALVASGQIAKLIRLKNQRIALGQAWHSPSG